MSKWRPEKLKIKGGLRGLAHRVLASKYGLTFPTDELLDQATVLVEAGADAMLEALRKDGSHFGKDRWTDDAGFRTEEPGTVVFIPDKG